VGKTSAESKNKYRNKTYDQINIIVPKGAKERIVEAATATGQSTNGFIRSSLNEAVERATGRPMEAVSPHEGEV
jgi:predicted HicB family RNase H-like nuclease